MLTIKEVGMYYKGTRLSSTSEDRFKKNYFNINLIFGRSAGIFSRLFQRRKKTQAWNIRERDRFQNRNTQQSVLNFKFSNAKVNEPILFHLKNQKRFMQWAMGGFVLVVMLLVYHYGLKDIQDLPLFKLKQISIQGIHFVTKSRILKSLDVSNNENMFKLNLFKIQHDLKKIVWIKNVLVERRLPNTLVISVKERHPLAVINGSMVCSVDKSGRILGPSTALVNNHLPQIEGVAVPVSAIGTKRLSKLLYPAIHFLKFIDHVKPLWGRCISRISLLNSETLKVVFVGGLKVLFPTEVSRLDLERMSVVLNNLRKRKLQPKQLDFRFNNMVVVQVRS